MARAIRVMTAGMPYSERGTSREEQVPWMPRDGWPCFWIHPAETIDRPQVTAYRLAFHLSQPVKFRCHVSADERYELYLDGMRIGRGSERGDASCWYYETYEIELEPGSHSLAARTWALGELAPWAQVSVKPGFLLSPEEPWMIEKIGTGRAKWEYAALPGYEFHKPGELELGSGPITVLDGASYPWGFEKGGGDGWKEAMIGSAGNNGDYLHVHAPVHRLFPSTLPPMEGGIIRSWTVAAITEAALEGKAHEQYYPPGSVLRTERFPEWERLREGAPVAVPPYSRLAVLLDLHNYYCGYTRLRVSGGAGSEISVSWSEALYECGGDVSATKGDRRVVEGKFFRGIGDRWLPDGGNDRSFETLWWTAGRYVHIRLVTGHAPLLLDSLELEETRYPLEIQGEFSCDDASFRDFIPVAVRSLQMCMHETYMDCPYWEQLMYAGDTRLQILLTYILSPDIRPVRKALAMFQASSVNSSMLPASSYPDRNAKLIPSFCMWWISMIHDYALWRGDDAFVRSLMPSARMVVDRLLLRRGRSGLAAPVPGWNYMDATEQWKYGIPPADEDGVHAAYNWQLAYTCVQMAELEQYAGEPELEQRYKRLAEELGTRLIERYWDEDKGLFADDEAHRSYSEHTQSLSVLSGLPPAELMHRIGEGLASVAGLNRTSIYFSHYLFEAYTRLGRTPLLLGRLRDWWKLKEQGLLTTPESFSCDTRSDCHAWGAHPLYHLAASLAGIRPAAMGFRRIVIEPRLGGLGWVTATMPHPSGGLIRLECRQNGDSADIELELPDHLAGELRFGGDIYPIRGGACRFQVRLTGTHRSDTGL